MVAPERIRILKKGTAREGPVVYWMSRDQRASDNWALLFAQELALSRKAGLAVLFCLVPEFLGATGRQYGFMLRGLQEVEKSLARKGIPFFLEKGTPGREVPEFLKRCKASVLVRDFDPLRIKRDWTDSVAAGIDLPFYEVDSHNIVPCRIASARQEYGAYTLRPKIRRLLSVFVEEFPKLRRHTYRFHSAKGHTDWDSTLRTYGKDSSGGLKWPVPGEEGSRTVLRAFIRDRLANYDRLRNDPVQDGQSDLSPYLHFGQISAQRVALEVAKTDYGPISREAFLEELIVRRELSDNFCLYNNNYDNFDGLPEWGRKTLTEHRKDKRPYLYSREQFENAGTHDELWNAAQMEMVKRGKMHGYMRMYWGKKILEWSESPERAMETAIYLNDRYELDGRDPNGYAGIAWCIGGLHDRAWGERPVFGKVRYMSYNGCRSKFDVKKYTEYVRGL